ncbi:MAG: hypothetical protein ACE5KD_02825 [Candidatus Bathyarchaeia archaeon]
MRSEMARKHVGLSSEQGNKRSACQFLLKGASATEEDVAGAWDKIAEEWFKG